MEKKLFEAILNHDIKTIHKIMKEKKYDYSYYTFNGGLAKIKYVNKYKRYEIEISYLYNKCVIIDKKTREAIDIRFRYLLTKDFDFNLDEEL